MDYFLLYLYGVTDSIRAVIYIFAIIFAILLVIATAIKSASEETFVNAFTKGRIALILGMILFASIIPTRQSILMVGGYGLGKNLLQSTTSTKFQELINSELDSKIKDVKGTVNDTVKEATNTAVSGAINTATDKAKELISK